LSAWLAAHRLPLSLALVVLALLGAGVYFGTRPAESPLVVTVPTAAPAAGGPKAYISGEVARPGVYQFQTGDRVEQLIALAGGFTAEADASSINLALRLKDEQQVHVPRVVPSPTPGGMALGASTSASKLIDLNTASAAELESLPGIGQAIAQRIIDHRTKVGPFVKTEDLLTLKLVNSSTYEKVRDLVTVQ
jgi:competence protein ComEA